MSNYKYIGFLSYAHADETKASRLHKALETYRIPKNIELTEAKTLSPIFRDTTELTAHHSLSEKIREAVERSRFLIVLCSPAAKTSHWVNEEIRLFRSLHGEGSILCVLAQGTPETSFPPALTEGEREPLAANLGGGKDSFRLGTTQLAASMLGVGLDTLIQRETKRRRRRLQLITASALIFSGVMGATAFTAIEARNDAQDSRAQAEGLVEYMITDLKDKLEPVGRLDLLDSIGDKAVDYYNNQEIGKLSDESLTRQAKARHVLGQVAITEGDDEKARREIEAALDLTEEILKRNPNDSDAIFAHAQSEYWVGERHQILGNYEVAIQHMKNYAALGGQLYKLNPNNFNWVMERGWGSNNVALIYYRLKNFQLAKKYYLEAIDYFEDALKISPKNPTAKRELANAIAGVSNTSSENENYEISKIYTEKQILLLSDIIESNPDNINLQYRHHRAKTSLYKLDALLNSSSCDVNQSRKLLDAYQTYVNHDSMNYSWQHDFAAYGYEMLKACPSLRETDEYNRQIEKLLSHVDETLNEEDRIKERAKIIMLR